jgi:hypothetical protein
VPEGIEGAPVGISANRDCPFARSTADEELKHVVIIKIDGVLNCGMQIENRGRIVDLNKADTLLNR